MQSSEGQRGRSFLVLLLALISALCSLAVPLLPVQQATASFAWGGAQWKHTGGNDVTAPLVALVPVELHASIPCSALASLPADGRVLLSTDPKDGAGSQGRGLFVQAFADQVQVTSHGQLLISVPRKAVAGPQCQQIDIWATPAEVGVAFKGLDGQAPVVVSPHYRPEVSGVFTDLKGELAEPPSLDAVIDTRFAVTPTVIKTLAVLLAVLSLLAALVLSWGTLARPGLRLPRVRPLDLVVGAVLLGWNWLGGYSADDGYLIVMGRSAQDSGYLANYYRYFGAAEGPFDWYYRVLSFAAQITDHGVWLRLISVAAGFLTWLLISRAVLPQRRSASVAGGLGRTIARHPLALPTAAAVLLAFWLPLCSGLRPEALITLGALATWCLAERAISSERHSAPLAALTVLVAAFTQALAPQGLIATAVLLAAVPAILRKLQTPVIQVDGIQGADNAGDRHLGAGPFKLTALSLITASGLVVLPVIFAQQTFAGVLEAVRLRYAVDATADWSQEFLRWNALLAYSPEGSISRRWPLLAMLLCLGVVVFALSLRKIPGVRSASLWRLVCASFLTMLLLSFVPYKWPEHFGVFAAFGAVLAAAATALAAQYAKRGAFVPALVASSAFFFAALAVSGKNGWFWVQGFSIPATTARPYLGTHALNTVLLLFFVLFAVIAGVLYLRRDYAGATGPAHERPVLRKAPWRKALRTLADGPILWLSAAFVAVELIGFLAAAGSRYPGYSVVLGNVRAVAGSCELAEAVLGEADPNAGMLLPADGADPEDALGAVRAVGFTRTGLPEEIDAIGDGTPPGIPHVNHSGPEPVPVEGQDAGANRGYSQTTHALALPFGLAANTPVLGSYGSNTGEANLVSAWYALGPITADTPLVVLSAAGHIAGADADGAPIYGQDVTFEFGGREGDTSPITPAGSVVPFDPVVATTSYPWRNLRVPTSAIPRGAAFVRVVVNDHDLQPDQWVAVTPPRLPHLVTLQQLIGSHDPVLLDFAVAAQFPCQRPFSVHDGVAQLPKWRVLPDHRLAGTASQSWLSDPGGGPLGIVEPLLNPTTVPTYFTHDWRRDWGSVQRYTLIPKNAVPATITTRETPRWGWWRPGPSQALEPA